jgi:hypothetical protein
VGNELLPYPSKGEIWYICIREAREKEKICERKRRKDQRKGKLIENR